MNKVILGVFMFAPMVMFALIAHAAPLDNVDLLASGIGKVVKTLIPIVFALILLYFFWGLMKFVMNSGDEEERKKGKQMMIWGVVALFVASSIWGLTTFMGTAIFGGTASPGSVTVPSVTLP